MAAKPTPQTPQQTAPVEPDGKNAPGAGRPSAGIPSDATPEQRAKAAAQYALDRINAALVDAPNTSYVAKVAVCARLGVLTQEQALAGLRQGVASALRDAETAIARIYANPQAVVKVASRVTL